MSVNIRLTKHALNRAEEMGIPLGTVCDIVRRPNLTYCSKSRRGDDGMIAVRDDYPDWAVVYKLEGDRVLVTSVVFRTYEDYQRQGESFGVIPC